MDLSPANMQHAKSILRAAKRKHAKNPQHSVESYVEFELHSWRLLHATMEGGDSPSAQILWQAQVVLCLQALGALS